MEIDRVDSNMDTLTANIKTFDQWEQSPLPRYDDVSFWKSLNRDSSVMRHIRQLAQEEKNQPPPILTASEFMGFTRTGLREPYHPKMKKRRDRLALFAVAECLDRKGEYIDPLTDEVWAICEESSWIAPAHVREHGGGQREESLPSPHHVGFDLLVAMTAQSLAEILYMMEDQLHPYVSDRIRCELEQRVFRPARENDYKWFYYGSNWTSVCTGGTISAALLTEREHQRLKVLLDKMLPFLLDTYVGKFTNDGGCSEGILCWNLGFKHFTYTVDLLEHAVGGSWNGFERDKVKQISLFPYRTYMYNGCFPTFSEPPENFLPHPWLIDYLADRLEDRRLEWLIRDMEPYYDMDHIVNPDECFSYDLLRLLSWYEAKYDTDAQFGFHKSRQGISATAKASDRAGTPVVNRAEDTCYLPDLGWLVIAKSNGLSIAAKAGHNAEMHNHNDLGNIIAFSPAGDALLADLGKGRMTRSFFIHSSRYEILEASSLGHNVPRVNGCEQQYGPQFRSTWKQPANKAGRIEWEVDISGAYSGEADVERLVRKLEAEQGETANRFRLCDEFAFRMKAGSYESALYTYADRIEQDDHESVHLSFASGYGLQIRYDSHQWSLTIEDAGKEVTRERPYPVHRLLWKPKRKMKSGVWSIEAEMSSHR